MDGIELRLIFGAIMSGTTRALIETPLEYAKVMNYRFNLFTESSFVVGSRVRPDV